MQKCALLRFVAEKELLRLMKFPLIPERSATLKSELNWDGTSIRWAAYITVSKLRILVSPPSFLCLGRVWPSLYAAAMLMHVPCDKHAPGAEVRNGVVSGDRAGLFYRWLIWDSSGGPWSGGWALSNILHKENMALRQHFYEQRTRFCIGLK